MSYRPGPSRTRRLEDEFYRILNRFNNREWNQFARSGSGLQLPSSLIDDIRSDYSSDVREQKYQMLSLWQRRKGQRATVELLNNIVDQFFEHLRQQEQRAPERHGNAAMANDDIEFDQAGGGHSQDCSLNHHSRPGSLQSQYVHSDNDRWFTSRSNNLQPTSLPQSWRHIQEDTMPNLAAAAPEGSPSSIRATSTSIEHNGDEKVEVSNCSRPRTSSETVPKEVGASTPQDEKVSQKAAYVLRKAFHPHSFVNPNANVKISVFGDHAVGIQTNYYTDDYKISKAKKQPETAEQLAEYCTKVTSNQVGQSDQYSYDDHLDKSIYIYKISHIPKGAVLLINNSFPDQCDERRGSESDLKFMDEMWNNIGCKTFKRTNLSAAETIPILKKFALSSHAYNSDFVTVVVMSHGGLEDGEDVFYSADRKAVKIREVLDIFNNVNARRLQGIPKLFFFQICRGNSVDKGVERQSPEEREQELSDLFKSMEVTVQNASGSNNEDSSDALGTPVERVPTMSDCMISFATLAGYKAFRNNQNGSWYVNAIVNIFSRYAKDQHVIDLMTMVNAAVEKKTANSRHKELNYGKEMSNFQSTLTKKLFLFPGFPDVKKDDDF